MSAYRIVQEHHVMPETYWDGKKVPSIEFFYAIRREDGSLCFRAETIKQVDELLSRLHYHTARKAAA